MRDAATGLGPSRSPVRVPGSLPREEEVEAARQELMAEATRAALARAGAAAARTQVAGVQRIEINPVGAPLPYAAEAAARMLRTPTPVPPIASAAGEIEVTVRVLATVRLTPGEAGAAR